MISAIQTALVASGYSLITEAYGFMLYAKGCTEVAINDEGVTVKEGTVITGYLHHSKCDQDTALLFLLATNTIQSPYTNHHELHNISDHYSRSLIGGGNSGAFFPRRKRAA